MSVFNNYTPVSVNYDVGRNANGVKHYLGLVYSLTGKTAENVNLGDFGCGTGNHTKCLLDKGIAKATMFDANAGMLTKAREKLAKYEGKVTIEQHKLPEIPYADKNFDLVTFNQVLHHLTAPGENDTKTDNHRQTALEISLREAYRVLKPNSVIIVNLASPRQSQQGYWFTQCFPDQLVQQYGRRFPEPEKFCNILRQTGFENVGMLVEPMDLIIDESVYFREDGVLYPEWRAIDSLMSSASAKEIAEAERMVHELKKTGKLREFMLEADKDRRHVGQYNIYYAKKA